MKEPETNPNPKEEPTEAKPSEEKVRDEQRKREGHTFQGTGVEKRG